MKFDAQFLTQYRGGTAQTATIIDRFAWATVEVEIEDHAARSFTPALRRRSVGLDEFVYHDGGSYWANADHLAGCHRGFVGYIDDDYARYKPLSGLTNFQISEQRRSAWNSFGFNFFEKYPVRHAFTIEPRNLKNYRPGGKIEWDETDLIARRYSSYLRENFVCMEGMILCRIERPCFVPRKYRWQTVDVFTPVGGHGDPVLDFTSAYAASFDASAMAKAGWDWLITPSEIEDFDRNSINPWSRSVRAVFMDLVRNTSWISDQKAITRSKAAKKLLALHDIWRENGRSISEDQLDNVVDILLTIAEPGNVRNILDAWADRPINL